MPTVLFGAAPGLRASYLPHLASAFAEAGLDVRLVTEAAPEEVDYIVYSPRGTVPDFTPFTRCRAVLNLWAGVETVVGNRTLTQPLCRMVDPAMTESMVEWVVGHVLRLHLGMDEHIHGQDGVWRHDETRMPKIARERPVTILGFGELGQACARALMALNFPVTGWSRRATTLAGARCLAGAETLDAALEGAAAVILLLPRTPETENILGARRLGLLAPGAFVINPGRGALVDDEALLAALESGQVGHATLDVFREEPLPPEHPFWSHPRVTVTPHIAAATRPDTAARLIAENVRRGEAGESFLHVVDRTAGY